MNVTQLLALNARKQRCDPDSGHPDNSTSGLQDMLRSLTTLNMVLEIGSYRGVSAECFALMAKHVICVDHWSGREGHTYQPFLQIVSLYANISILHMMSKDAFEIIGYNCVDMVYIDGAHDYNNVNLDITLWHHKCRHLSGHDYGIPDVKRAVDEYGLMIGRTPEIFADSSWLFRDKPSPTRKVTELP